MLSPPELHRSCGSCARDARYHSCNPKAFRGRKRPERLRRRFRCIRFGRYRLNFNLPFCRKKKPPSRELFLCRSGPVSRVLSSKTAIYLGRALPHVSSRLPACTERRAVLHAYSPPSFGWGLPSHAVASVLVRSYRTFSAFPLTRFAPVGVFFSAALSVGFPRPAVSRHPASRSPDFPHGSISHATVRPA